jgi:DNA-binding SARP family transcriptional activator
VLRFHLFGRFEVEIDGRVHDAPEWRRGRVRSLAKLLSLAPAKRMHRDRIIDALWPELTPGAAANQLDKTVHFLRRALKDELPAGRAVRVESGHIGLAEDTVTDLDEFLSRARAPDDGLDIDAIEAALALARDPLLPDDPYEPWAVQPRRVVDELRLRLLDRLAKLHREAGATGLAERVLGEILRIDPASEEAHRGLMEIAAGRQDWRSAIRRYDTCRDRLWEELAVEPSPETERLRQDILSTMLAASTGSTDAERAALIEELADALRQTGQADKAAQLYANAIALYGPIDDPAARRVRGKIALAYILAGDVEAAEAHIGPIRDSLEREWPAYLTARTLYLLAQLRWHSGRYGEALEAAERAVRAARASDDLEHQARAQEVLALACHALGDWRRGIEAEIERERIAAETGFGFDEVLEAHLCLWEYSLYGDRPFAEVESSIKAALERAEEAGNVGAMAVAEHAMGSVLMVVGRWPEARQALARSLRLARSIAAPQGTVLGLQRLALLETISGDIEAGHARVMEAFDAGRASSSAQVKLHSFSRMNATLAINRFLAGDLDSARAALAEGASVQRDAGECITCDSLIHPTAVPIHLAAGESGLAERALEKTRAAASSFRGHSRAAVAQHAAGLVFAARRRWVDADRRLSRAVSTFESAGQPYELGRSLVALAAVRRAGGERDWESVDLRARTILDRLGSDPDPDRLKSWLPDNAG